MLPETKTNDKVRKHEKEERERKKKDSWAQIQIDRSNDNGEDVYLH